MLFRFLLSVLIFACTACVDDVAKNAESIDKTNQTLPAKKSLEDYPNIMAALKSDGYAAWDAERAKLADELLLNPDPTLDDAQKIVRESIRMAIDYGKLAPNDFNRQFTVAQAVLLSGYTVTNVHMDSEEFFQKGFELSKNLVERFPNKAMAHGQYAHALIALNKDRAEIEASLAKCFELEPNNVLCTQLRDKKLNKVN